MKKIKTIFSTSSVSFVVMLFSCLALLIWLTPKLSPSQGAGDFSTKFSSSLAYESSDLDWCEPNYVWSPHIVEFFNTISNILFLTWPPALIYLYKSYVDVLGVSVNVVWGLLVVVGLGSAYFHATLSYFGQLWDEIGILWAISAAVGAWLPRDHAQLYLRVTRSQFQILMFLFSVVTSCLGFVKPTLNAFLLLAYGSTCSISLFQQCSKCNDRRAKTLCTRTLGLFLLAVGCWVVDRFACDVCISLRFPYLHAIWHLLVLVSAVSCCVLLSYFDALREAPLHLAPRLTSWPSHELGGIPYVKLDRALDCLDCPLKGNHSDEVVPVTL